MTMIGQTLTSAREAKGYTIDRLAELTRMAHGTIEALESERFDSFAAPIYVRGFIKLYAKAVGIDPLPLLTEYQEILNGNREPSIRERVVAPVEETPPESASPAVSEPVGRDAPSAPMALSEPIGRDAPSAPIEPEPITAAEPPPAEDFHLESEVVHGARFARYAAPIREYAGSLPSVPTPVWRFALIGIVALVFLWVLFLGVRALYRATTPADTAATKSIVVGREVPVAPPPAVKPAAKPTVKRTPQKIPPLYLD